MVRNKSFTLIELLVVIAIIGLLSSIVLVSMGGVRSKAKIAKGLEFSQSVQHALGAYAVGIWGFDEGSGTVALDGSGYGNNGTVNGAAYTIETPHKAAGSGTDKYALSFDGADYVNAGNDASLNPTQAITVEAWVKLNSISGNQGIVTRGGYAYGLQWNGALSRWFWTAWDTGYSYCLYTTTPVIGRWYHVVGTTDTTLSANPRQFLYIDGKKVASCNLTGPIRTTTGNTEIGKDAWGTNYFNGTIDEVRIYEKALTLGEIQKHYAEGLEMHKDLVTK